MKHAIQYLPVLLLGAGALLLAQKFPGSDEPRYKGHRLREWVAALNTPKPSELHEHANEALRQMGTNALPLLLQILQSKDSRPKQWLMKLGAKYRFLHLHLTPARDRQVQAVIAFQTLGPVARPAVPVLGELFNQEETAANAAYCLVAIGSDSLPVLFQAITNSALAVRGLALASIRDIGAVPASFVPILIGSLKDPSAYVRLTAAMVLGKNGTEPALAVATLLDCLKDVQAGIRIQAIFALRAFPSEAKTIVPKLRQAAQDQDINVSRAANFVLDFLMKLDPETSAQAEQKN